MLEDVSLHNVRIMLELLSDATIRDTEYLRRRYTERAQHFDATLALLKHSHIVDDHGHVIQTAPGEVATQLSVRELSELLVERLLMTNSPFRDDITSYLRQFRILDGQPVHRPTTEQRSAESDIRNFFMELGVVSYDSVNGQYTLAADKYSIYLLANRSVTPVSPSQMQQRRSEREDVGLAAELEIVSFEQQRLGERFTHRVCHTAVTNAAAGYDIESVTIGPQDQLYPRLIEVKCVSLEDYRFFWTANEVATAQALGSWYYLYLLPSSGPDKLRIDMLRIIPDPQVAILNCPEEWSVEDNVLECKIRSHLE